MAEVLWFVVALVSIPVSIVMFVKQVRAEAAWRREVEEMDREFRAQLRALEEAGR